VTTESGLLLDDVRDVPAWTPTTAQLADLELLLSGALRPLTGFQGREDTTSVRASGRLADGTPWPEPITLTVPDELSKEERVVLQDPEGVPIALLRVTEAWRDEPDSPWRLAGPVTPLRVPSHGPYLRWRMRPDQVRAELAAATGDLSGDPATAAARQAEPGTTAAPTAPTAANAVNAASELALAAVTRTPLHRRRLGQIRHAAERLGARLLVLALVGGDRSDALVRTVLAARSELPAESLIVTVPLHPRAEHRRERLLHAHIAAAYGATHLLADEPDEEGAPDGETPIPVIAAEPWAYDTDVEVWRPAARIEPEAGRPEMTEEQVAELLGKGEEIPDWMTPPAVARELRAANPPRHERGLTVFFTGLSGSGKSTIARALADALVERGGRTVSLLDGDVVRRLLSAGLTFSKADRDLNIRRIGYVASEISRHGGVAVCAPIAPYETTRAEVRRMVTAVADFVLIHVNTPLAECERRDRKGLYAKARAGAIPAFTGISDPYEEPTDADLTIDTSRLSPQESVESILALLTAGGWIRDGAL
jgi:sulfate adenylyltransferase